MGEAARPEGGCWWFWVATGGGLVVQLATGWLSSGGRTDGAATGCAG